MPPRLHPHQEITYPAPARVLIVRMSHLGDVMQAMPLVHAVRAAWPKAELGWAIQPEFAPLVEPFARVFPFDRRGGFLAWPRIRSALRAWRPDLVIDAQGNWKSAMCARLSGARRRYGFDQRAWQEPGAARLAGLAFAPADLIPGSVAPENSHLVARCQSIAAFIAPLGSAGTGLDSIPIDPLLSATEIEHGRNLLHGTLGEPSKSPLTILQPGVPGDPRSWPAERFRELGERLLQAGECVLFLTGPGEAETGADLARTVPKAHHIVGQRNLRDLCALLRAAADARGQIFVGDSGPAHVAASVGLPVRLFAGPEDPNRTGPWPLASHADSPHSLVPASGVAEWTPRPIESVSVDDAVRCALER